MTKKPAGKWRKSPDDLIALFDAAVPKDKRVERRKMFGYPAAFVNGNLFMGLHQDDFMLRLGESDRAELARRHGGTPFEPMPGRRMREYMVVPRLLLSSTPSRTEWIGRSLAYACSLPPKSKQA